MGTDRRPDPPCVRSALTLTALPPLLPFPFLPSRLLAPAELCARRLGPLICHCISHPTPPAAFFMAKTLQVAELGFPALDQYPRSNVQDHPRLRLHLRDHRENILPHRRSPRLTIDRAPIPNTARP